MAARRNEAKPRRAPATTPEGREKQVISLAVDLAEKQIREGTATSQVLTHFLKLGTAREELDLLRLRSDVELQKAKIEAMASSQRMEQLYEKAIRAMRVYSGAEPEEDEDDVTFDFDYDG